MQTCRASDGAPETVLKHQPQHQPLACRFPRDFAQFLNPYVTFSRLVRFGKPRRKPVSLERANDAFQKDCIAGEWDDRMPGRLPEARHSGARPAAFRRENDRLDLAAVVGKADQGELAR